MPVVSLNYEDSMNEYDVKRLGLILAVQAEIEGMKAENQTRVQNGEALAYSDTDFSSKAAELQNLVYSPKEML